MGENRGNIMDKFLEAVKDNEEIPLNKLSPYEPAGDEEMDRADDMGKAIDYAREYEKMQQKLLLLVKEALDSRKIQYSYANEMQTWLKFSLEEDNKKLDIIMEIRHPTIRIIAYYPFRVQCNAIVLVSLFIGAINDRSFAECVRFDHHNGKLYLVLDVLSNDGHRLDMESLLAELDYLTGRAFCEYTRLSNYAVGKIGSEESDFYERMLLEAINGLMEDEISYHEIRYGSDEIMKWPLLGSDVADNVDKWSKKLQKTADDNFPFC